MPYGTIKVDTVTFTDSGVDKSVSISGLVQNPTFSGNVTVTGTISGVTVTGTTASFTSGNFTNISVGTYTITSGVFSAGFETNPSITFTGDLNTGIYSPGADQVAISTNGTKRIEIQADGDIDIDNGGVFYDATNNRLAIGTTTPGYLLTASTSSTSTTLNDSAHWTVAVQNAAAATANQFNSLLFRFNDGIYNGNSIISALRESGTGRQQSLIFAPANSSGDPTERARIDSSGRLLVGTSSGRGVGSTVQLLNQIESTSGNYPGLSITQNGADTGAGYLHFGKTRGTSVGSNTIVQNGDRLGSIRFAGADGTDLESVGGQIECYVEGTPANNSVASRLVFSTTADGESSPTERMRIAQNGVITIQNGAVAVIGTLTDGATITPDFAADCNFTVTLGGNRTIANPTNITAGQSGSIFIVQDATGSRTLSWGSSWDFPGGTAPTLSTAANAVDRIDYIVRSSTSIHTVFTANYS